MAEPMRLKVSLSGFSVEKIRTSYWKAGASSNGQHPQLKGFVLVDVHLGLQQTFFHLYHPDTDPCTGHYDLAYWPGRHYENKTPLETYAHWQGIRLENLHYAATGLNHTWPTGVGTLIKTLEAVELFLQQEIGGYEVTVWDWLVWQTKPGQAFKTDQEIEWENNREDQLRREGVYEASQRAASKTEGAAV